MTHGSWNCLPCWPDRLFSGPVVGQAGVVLDFIAFKPLVKRVCDALDHRTLIQSQSPVLKVQKQDGTVLIHYKKQKINLPRQDVILITNAGIAERQAEQAATLLPRLREIG
jgi:6-pyruvoyltetrahydropterin/6-carboxytetrahydropterin synthase